MLLYSIEIQNKQRNFTQSRAALYSDSEIIYFGDYLMFTQDAIETSLKFNIPADIYQNIKSFMHIPCAKQFPY